MRILMYLDEDEEDLATEGMVFNIQKYSVHDGPGIRTIVFLKGCSLHCKWCSNPESQHRHPELAWNAGRCIGLSHCGHCREACPNGALAERDNDKPALDRSLCGTCSHLCAEACPAQGLLVYGKKRTVGDVLDRVEQDMAFYSRSGGGMTLSGGEPMLQKNFAVALLRQARRRRMKTAIETCGMAPEENFALAAPYLGHALFDIKHIDSDAHKEATGAPNEQILHNFQFLVKRYPKLPVLARTPLIPGFNADRETIHAIASFLKPFSHVRYEMLPYHRLGTQKYDFLQRPYAMGDIKLDKSLLPELYETARSVLGDRALPIK